MQPPQPNPGLVIDRHAMQTILLAAQQSPQTCRGIFGGPEARHITQAALAGRPEAASLIAHAEANSLGLFYTAAHEQTPDIARLRNIAAEFQLAVPHHCILLGLDTAGRIEARAFRIQAEDLVPEPLEMTEDHALSQAPANR